MKNLINRASIGAKKSLNFLSSMWRGVAANAGGSGGRMTSERQSNDAVLTLEGAYIEHPFSIDSAYIGTTGKPAGKMLKIAAMLCLLLTLGVGNAWGETSGYSVTASNGALSGWTGAVGSKYNDGSVKFGTQGNNLTNSSIWSGAVSTGMTSISVTVEYKINGTASDNNVFTISAVNSTGTVKASATFAPTSTSKTTVTKTITVQGSYAVTGLKLDYTTKAGGNVGLYSVSATATYTAATPTITPSVSELDWGTVAKGAALTTKTFTITGTNLTSADLVYSASSGYSVSPSGKAGAAGTLASQTLTVTPPSTATPGTYNSTVSITGGGLASAVTVDVKLKVENTDAFIDEVHSTTGYTSGSPHIEQGSYGTTPTIADKSVATSGTCEQLHYHFVGWITAAKYEAGTAIAVGDLQTPTSATGATYYAVWAKQAAGGGGDVTDVINNSVTTSHLGASGTSTWVDIWETSAMTSGAKYKIRSMGINGASNYALQFNSNGYLFCSSAPSTGLKLKSIAITTLATKNIGLYGSTSVYSAKASSTSLTTLSATTSGATYSLTSAQLANNYNCVGINGTASSTQIVSISITYSGAVSYEDYIAKCCTALGTINGSISFTDPTTAVVSWDNIANVSSWTVKYKVHGSSWNTWAGDQTVYTKSTTNDSRKVTITGLTCNTAYDFQIIATPASGYCDKDETLDNSGSGYNSGKWSVTHTLTNVTKSSGQDAGTGVLCGDYSATFAASSGFTLPTSITVTGASSHSWNSSTGALSISSANITGNLTITISGNAAANFTNGETVFIQADSKDYSAWKDDACVKAYFNTSGSGGSAVTTYWLFDATDTDAGKKLFAAVVPSAGLNQVQLQRFASNCSTWWNSNGDLTKASSSGVNTFRSYGSANNNVAWNGSSTSLYLYGSQNSWASSLGTFADQGSGVWTATISNYAPDATSKDYKIKTSYNNGWIGNGNSNDNATLSGMKVGSTYNVTATLNVTTHALTMSKTFVKGTVSFDLQGHGSAISDLTNVTAGSKISAPSAPTADGYTFGGWYKEAGCTNAWNFASDVVNETMTLYAKWTLNTYTVNYNKGTNGSGTNTSDTKTHGVNLTLKGAIFTREHYTQTGWATSDGGAKVYNLSGSYTTNAGTTLYPVWTADNHTVTWKVNGSSYTTGSPSNNADYGTKVAKLPSAPSNSTLSCATKFMGWSKSNLGATTGQSAPADLFTTAGGSPTITGNTTFYAVFATEEDDTYWEMGTIDQLTSGSGYATYDGSHTVTGSDGNSYTYTSSNVMSNSGNQFRGSSYCGRIYNTASLGSISRIVLTYSAYKGEMKVYESDSEINASGTTALTESISGENDEIYTYDCSGKGFFIVIQEGSHAAKANVTVYFGGGASDYVTECDATKAKVTYDLNGGTGGCATGLYTKEGFRVCNTAVTKTGYTFSGWNDGTSTYAANASYTLTTNVTFTAQWTPTSYSITYNLDGGTNHGDNPSSYTIESSAITLQTPTKTADGYEYDFTGWTDDDNSDAAITTIAAGSTGNKHVTAHWAQKKRVRWYVGNTVQWTTFFASDGSASLALPNGGTPPSVPPTCGSKVFAGWTSDTPWDGETNTVPTVLFKAASGTVSADVDYYAVWADEHSEEAEGEIFSDAFNISGTDEVTSRDGWSSLSKLYGGSGSIRFSTGGGAGTMTLVKTGLGFGTTVTEATITFKIKKYGSDGSGVLSVSSNFSDATTTFSKDGGNTTSTSAQYSTTDGTNWTTCTCTVGSISASTDIILEGQTNSRVYVKDFSIEASGTTYTYDKYAIVCCNDPELEFGQTRYSLVREDLHGNTSAEYSTIELTYSSSSSGTIRVWTKEDETGTSADNVYTTWQYTGANTWGTSPTTGGTAATASTHAYFEITDAANGKAKFYVKNTAGNTQGQGTYRVALHQAANGGYCETVTYCWIDVTLRDKFVDNVNGNTFPNADGHGPGGAAVTTPAESTRDAAKDDDCHETTRRLVGWVKETDMDSWYGTGQDRTRDLDDKKDDAKLVAPGATITTSGATWYAIWGIEE